MTAFGAALESAVALLRRLDRSRAGVRQARELVAGWSAAHPELNAELVTDLRPGSPVVDYDLLLDHPDGGTVALTSPPDDGVPWLIDHSTHWAANQLVSVDGGHLSLPEAMVLVRSLGRHDEIVELCLVRAAVAADPEPLSDAELQEAADDFRRARGLHDRAAMLAWLEAMGLTPESFQDYIEEYGKRRRFRRRKEAELAPGWLAQNPATVELALATWVITHSPTPVALPEPAEQPVWELPEPLRSGDRVGPVRYGDGWLTGEVRTRRPAPDGDERALRQAGQLAYAAWLAERRTRADVRWHWW
ncbi:TIGR04500 family putative peptide maturation system protein [Nonomuraea sp. NPDC050328]|uniref:TIGR04500 family putative peptide maturation system protein n=1 Tax=Nonomuraea sp. NPDC050328 TaxID=3364361 RepID=UPI0037A5425D